MPERRPVETNYRGQVVRGEWCVENGHVHVFSVHGQMSRPLTMGVHITLPSEQAAAILWRLMRENDPDRPFFFWR